MTEHDQGDALRKAHAVAASDSYFAGKSTLDTQFRHSDFDAGFTAAWNLMATSQTIEVLALKRARDLALRRMQESTAYCIELAERLSKYEPGAPMVLNRVPASISTESNSGAVSASRQQSEPDTWLPMATAPKDGTEVLVFPEGGYDRALFQDGFWFWQATDSSSIAAGPEPKGWRPLPSETEPSRQDDVHGAPQP